MINEFGEKQALRERKEIRGREERKERKEIRAKEAKGETALLVGCLGANIPLKMTFIPICGLT